MNPSKFIIFPKNREKFEKESQILSENKNGAKILKK